MRLVKRVQLVAISDASSGRVYSKPLSSRQAETQDRLAPATYDKYGNLRG